MVPPTKPPVKGQCFPSAYHMMRSLQDVPGAVLVHGTAWSPAADKRIWHAWVELGDVVYDAEELDQMREWNRDEFYRLTQAKAHGRWDWEGALLTMVRQMHMGPWVDTKGRPAKPKRRQPPRRGKAKPGAGKGGARPRTTTLASEVNRLLKR